MLRLQAAETLRRFNRDLEIESMGQNVSEENIAGLVERADIVFSCAPLFEERLLMNREAMSQGKFFVDGARRERMTMEAAGGRHSVIDV